MQHYLLQQFAEMDEDDEFMDDDDFGEASASALTDGGKKCTIFLIDASPKMFEKYENDDSDNDCAFRRALKVSSYVYSIDHTFLLRLILSIIY